MMFNRKLTKKPCHRNGYLQSLADARAHRNRFQRNPWAKVGSLWVPKPLRMSPGYPCCCEEEGGEPGEPCTCFYCDIESCDELEMILSGSLSDDDTYILAKNDAACFNVDNHIYCGWGDTSNGLGERACYSRNIGTGVYQITAQVNYCTCYDTDSLPLWDCQGSYALTCDGAPCGAAGNITFTLSMV